jgi:PAS domain-containing protein
MHEPVIKAVSRNALPLALLYFAALFLALVAIISGISALIYFQASSYIPAGAMQAVVNGMLVPVIASLALLVAISVVVSWFLGSLIARRSQAMAQLRVYTQLLNISPDSIYLHDIKGKCLYANEAALKLGDITYGTSEDAWQIKDAVMLTALDGVRIKQVLEKGDLTFEAAQVRKDGSTGLKYIGKKSLWCNKYFQKNGVTKKKRVERDWRNYYGSSPRLLE